MGLFASLGKAISSTFSSGARATPVTKPSGGDGVIAYGGYLPSPERSAKLVGKQKWVTYSNALNYPIVATWLYYFKRLISGAEWNCEPNELGGADAERAAEIVDQGLLKAQMPKPFQAVVGKAAMFVPLGHSLHEWTVKRRSDGMMVFAEIAHRPQHTIERWDKPDEREAWAAVEQLSPGGNRYMIPRGRLFYCVDDTLTDSPDGVGQLRHVAELVRQLEVLEGLEGHAYQTDLRGMPLVRAPLAELRALAITKGCTTDDDIKAFVHNATQNIREIAANSAKTPDKIPYILFDSEPFKGADPNVFTAVMRWSFELVTGQTNGLPEVDVLIKRKQTEIARVFGIEFAMMGSEGGAYAMHGDKTSTFGTCIDNALTTIGAFATNDLARPLVALNGLDPETCTPRLVAKPIATEAIEMVCRALAAMSQAGLPPGWDGTDVLLKRMHLPPFPAMTPDMMGVLGGRPRPPTDPNADPNADPAAGEEQPKDLGPDQEAA